MANEVRNLKGEIVSNNDPDAKWYSFSSSTWLLIGGLILFNVGCFVNPGWLGSFFRLLDIRLWPWWYFLAIGVILLFSVKWFFIYRNWEDYDSDEEETARRFMRMSGVISGVLLFLVLLNMFGLVAALYYPVALWLRYGAFSWSAFLTFSIGILLFGLIFYFVKEWIVTFLNK